MINYYSILGLQEGASLNEIKAAFRRLAKIYHPDKNPAGKEEFTKILRAYETLGDPSKKRAYDLKLKYSRNSANKDTVKKSGTKNWSFEERDLKRRKYYDEHIKRYEKHTGKDPRVTEIKSNYNEYKYILFATPLAVALFLLVVNLATGSKPPVDPSKKIIQASVVNDEALKMGDSPYTAHFGDQRYEIHTNKKLIVKNLSGKDIILCIFAEDKFYRSCFISDGFSAEIPQLPKKKFNIRYLSGKKWNADTLLAESGLYGSFTHDISYYQSSEYESEGIDELTLVNGENQGFSKIDQRTFFKKQE